MKNYLRNVGKRSIIFEMKKHEIIDIFFHGSHFELKASENKKKDIYFPFTVPNFKQTYIIIFNTAKFESFVHFFLEVIKYQIKNSHLKSF